MSWLKMYGDTEGPLGFPMFDKDARALDSFLGTLPEIEFRRLPVEKAMTDLAAGERADISWISTEVVDRQKDFVLAAGMDNSQYVGNPIVTMGHDYSQPPIGTSVWQRKFKEADLRGIKAKTIYPERPSDWTDADWGPDCAFTLIQSGLMLGKSIGFLTIDASPPTPDEVRANPVLADAYRVVRKWLLLEYGCTWLPVNQDAIVEQVSKHVITPNILKTLKLPTPPLKEAAPLVISGSSAGFTTEEEIKKALERHLAAIDCTRLARQAVETQWNKMLGRV